MKFDKWFYKQNMLIQIILLLIPGVNWVVECLIRLSVALRTKSVIHIVVFLLFIFVGWGYVLEVLDIIWLVLAGRLLFA